MCSCPYKRDSSRVLWNLFSRTDRKETESNLVPWGWIHEILAKMCLKTQLNRKITTFLRYVVSAIQASPNFPRLDMLSISTYKPIKFTQTLAYK